MVKAGRWLRNFLTGKKEKNQGRLMDGTIPLHELPRPPPAPPTTPNIDSMRFFHQPETAVKQSPKDRFSPPSSLLRPKLGRAAAKKSRFSAIQQVAAIKIQACFRSFLARKALRALKGLVKLQAVVRGFLVRKEAAATLRSMQALLTVQGRARAHRVRMINEQLQQLHPTQYWSQYNQRRGTNIQPKSQQLHDMETNANKNTIEMDIRQTRANSNNKSNPTTQMETRERRLFSPQKPSTAPSTTTKMCSGARDEAETFFTTTGSNSQHSSSAPKTRRINSSEASSSQEGSYLLSQDCSFFPSYMANTKSWKAKARSQSVPRQRDDLFDSNQSGKHRVSVDGRSISRAARASPIISVAAKEKIPWHEEFEKIVSNIDYYRLITT